MSTAATAAVAAAEPTGATSPAPRPLTSPQLLPTCVPRAVSDPVSATSSPAVPNTVTAVSPPALAPPSPSAAQDRPNLKRKTPPSVSPGLDADADADAEAEDDDEEEEDRKPLILAPGSPVPSSRRECSSVICKACGVVVRIGEMWDTHRGTCAGTARPAHSHTHSHSNPHAHPQPYPHLHQQQHRHHHPAQYAPPPPPPLPAVETTSYTSILSGLPPAKRRRAKRTEDERIAYLRADTHVAQFEAYRVLCASCDKWIRLRPNSTYCSIPWDAHRKSCLAKKSHAKNAHAYALDERNAAFAKDPDVRKFDAERLLCGVCDKWIALPVDDHLGAVQMWVQHRDGCRKSVGAGMRGVGVMTSNVRGMVDRDGADDECKPPQSPPSAAARSRTPPASSTSSRKHPYSPPPPPPAPASFPAPLHLPLPDAPHVVLDLSPANYAAPHESRRRNAEQRAATLRADVLIREVEPNRVFCSLCTKWVQLRQDSSYCAYPWLQHRGKCLAR
ncbi:unnamed protein product [Mycena citricolor]|uniref:Uncharacterized protein n=1 Tax=Mycena citricolor TaxID=2018698 RepID=A0AAD2H9L8_9AGAR|nr:unnamed protein product [Mycena citricolor]